MSICQILLLLLGAQRNNTHQTLLLLHGAQQIQYDNYVMGLRL